MGKIIRKRYDLPLVQNAEKTAKGDFELDKHTARVRGMLLTSDRDEMLYHRGTVQILLNGEEVIPDQYHTRLLMSGLGVAPKDRYLPMDHAPGNGILKVVYTDNNSAVQVFDPYTVSVYLETELEEDAQ
ncbi:MAG: hypothetical protein AAF998_18470 [Bacteroidota bacterium]